MMTDWLKIHRGDAPLIVSFPHTGTQLPAEIEARVVSSWRARKDADYWVDRLYAFVTGLGATTLRTTISRTVIDVNRDPSGASLYPGMTTTELCPLTTFDGEALYRAGEAPGSEEIEERHARYFAPYHAALATELARLRARYERVVVYDAHSIRSHVPRLFEGALPHLNVGTNDGQTCDPKLAQAVVRSCRRSKFSHVLDGRFKGGWTTRHYGQPSRGIHAIQMELACRAYMREPDDPFSDDNWPPAYEEHRAAPLVAVLQQVLQQCLEFAADRRITP